jgi:hypothetical protein
MLISATTSPNVLVNTRSGFPLIIICTTVEEAEDAFRCQYLIDELDLTREKKFTLAAIAESDEGMSILKNTYKFYGVLAGVPPGIYFD